MPHPDCLLATIDFPPLVSGGIQRYYYDFCRESEGRISVLAPDGEGCGEFDAAQSFEVTRMRLPLGGGAVQRLLLMLLTTLHTARLLFSARYKKLIVGHWFLLPSLIWFAKIRGMRTAVVMHGGELTRFRPNSAIRSGLVAIINRCDQVIVNSSYAANQFGEHGVDKSRIKILTPAVDSARYQPSPCTGLSPLNIPTFDGITLLTVATLVERKGHAAVISVLPRIIAAHPATRYVIIGDGPCRANLTAQVERLGLTGAVLFLGRATDEEVLKWLQLCDIFVMPSAKLAVRFGEEGFGIVYLEANACGKPVIGGNSGGVPDAVIHGVTGLLVNPTDGDELFQALDHLISSKDLRDSLGRQGRERVVNEFQWRDRIDALVE